MKNKVIVITILLVMAAIATAEFADLDEWSLFHRKPAAPDAKDAAERKVLAVLKGGMLRRLTASPNQGR